MKITIEAEPKEIAALVKSLEGQQKEVNTVTIEKINADLGKLHNQGFGTAVTSALQANSTG